MGIVIKNIRRVDFNKFSLSFLGLCVLGLYSTAVVVDLSNSAMPTEPTQVVDAAEASAPTIPESMARELAAIAPAIGEAGMAKSATPPQAAFDDPTPAPARKASVVSTPRRPRIVPIDTRRVSEIFRRVDYRIERVRAGDMAVPRILLASLPRDLRKARSVQQRKSIFLSTALPLILVKNEEIKIDRRRLLDIRKRLDAGKPVTKSERAWLMVLAKRYKVSVSNIDELVRRVDIIPPSLALAQAAEESGWGTSRFAQEGNAIFGQWAWKAESGIVPNGRKSGTSHVIRAFDHLLDSARAYAKNLNTHRAYRELRQKRAQMRAAGKLLDGYELAGALTRYSERGEEYVRSLRSIIRANELQAFDGARLDKTDLSAMLPPST